MRGETAVMLLLLAALLGGCTNLFFHPNRDEALTPAKLNLVYEDMYLPEGQHGWYLPAPGAARGTLLYLHGNAQNISTFIPAVWWLPARGYNVLMLDYSGYGKSAGVATVNSVHADAEAGLRYLVERGGVDRDRLILFGQSLGGSVALYSAAHSPHRDHLRAVIAEGAFSGYRRIAREKMQALWIVRYLRVPLSLLFNDDYSAEAAMPQLPGVPLLLIHGDHDEVVPNSHAQRLYAAAKGEKQLWVVQGGRHIDALTRPEYRERFVAWLDRVPPAALESSLPGPK